MTDELLFPEEITERLKAGMGCGSQIGEGWFDLVRQLDKDIAALAPDYRIDQVKEKIGSLRYYIGAVDKTVFSEVQKLIRKAEKDSSSICEKCGAPATIKTYDYLIAARCEEHEPS